MDTENPYASSTTITVDNGEEQRPSFHHFLWLLIILAAAIVAALIPIEELPLRRLPIFVLPIVMGSPAIYWELFCRKTPRPRARGDSINSSVHRWLFAYLCPALASLHIFAPLAGPTWLNGDDPATFVMNPWLGLVNASSVIFASFVFVMYDILYDRWRSMRL